MNKLLITHIFASLHNLERLLEQHKLAVKTHLPGSPETVHDILESEKVIEQMRRTANKIQIEFAKNNREETIRQTSIYYALHQMARPTIAKTTQGFAAGEKPKALQSEAIIH